MKMLSSKNNFELKKYGIKKYNDSYLSWEEFKKQFKWVLDAKIKEADIDLLIVSREKNEPYLLWQNGIWEYGTWKNGIWEYGTWKNGTWEDGTWKNGIWENGKWVSGEWYSGVWKGGTWAGGNWKNGIWKNGIWGYGNWINGTWKNGIWRKGNWRKGDWWSGIWLKGYFMTSDSKSYFKNGIFFNIEFDKDDLFDKFFDQNFLQCIIFNVNFKKEDKITFNIQNSIVLDNKFLEYSNVLKYRTRLK